MVMAWERPSKVDLCFAIIGVGIDKSKLEFVCPG